MQRLIGHSQRAYSTGILPYKTAQQKLKTGVQDFVFLQWSTHIYLKFESYNLQSKNLVHNHKGVDFYVKML